MKIKLAIFIVLLSFIINGCTPSLLNYYPSNIKGDMATNCIIKGRYVIYKDSNIEIYLATSTMIRVVYLKLVIKNTSKNTYEIDFDKFHLITFSGESLTIDKEYGWYDKTGGPKYQEIIVQANEKNTIYFKSGTNRILDGFIVNVAGIRELNSNKTINFDAEFKADKEDYEKYVKKYSWANK